MRQQVKHEIKSHKTHTGYNIRDEEQITCVTGNTLFQSKMSVNVFKLEIYILKWVKNIIAFLFILQEMKALRASEIKVYI